MVAALVNSQQPAPQRAVQPSNPLLVGQQIVDANSGVQWGTLGMHGCVCPAIQLTERQFSITDVHVIDKELKQFVYNDWIVDLIAMQVLEQDGTAAMLRKIDGERLWSCQYEAVHASGPRLLAPDRVVLAGRDSGLVVLDRKDGSIAWQKAGVPNGLLLLDGDMLLTAGACGGKQVLSGLAVRNGAAAFQVELPGQPRRIAASLYGLAAVGDGWFAILDRAGPKLFDGKEQIRDIIGCKNGWFVLRDRQVGALGREGGWRWCELLGAPGIQDRERLYVVPSGDLLVIKWRGNADSGVTVELYAAIDGARVWRREVPGLGVEHSLYGHEAYAYCTSDCVFVCSQGSAGWFVVALGVGDGHQIGRFQQGSR
jgi:hypothetical protein